MGKVYVVHPDGVTESMMGIRCKNEDLELQRILEKNPDLVPGDLIRPDDPRRWLVIKREMPVPDPNTGSERWSIDFFFSDQDAIPTFIECKRFGSTQARREVVGQMLEYAANGHYYWSKDEIRDYAEEFAKSRGLEIEDEIERLQSEQADTVDSYFEQIQDNLRQGQIRLVFFLEEAPGELKSLVDFLNKQMERSEVLLVEARQYEHSGVRIVAPTLFGYTEEARQVKKTRTFSRGERRKWDKESFFKDANERLTEKEYAAVKKVINKSQELKCEFSWGEGKNAGSFSAKWPHLGKNPLFHVYSMGTIMVNYGYFNNLSEQKELIVFLKNELETRMELSAPEDYERRYPHYKINQWSGKVGEFLGILESMIEKYPTRDSA